MRKQPSARKTFMLRAIERAESFLNTSKERLSAPLPEDPVERNDAQFAAIQETMEEQSKQIKKLQKQLSPSKRQRIWNWTAGSTLLTLIALNAFNDKPQEAFNNFLENNPEAGEFITETQKLLRAGGRNLTSKFCKVVDCPTSPQNAPPAQAEPRYNNEYPNDYLFAPDKHDRTPAPKQENPLWTPS